MPLASIPEPSSVSWRLGPVSFRAYALCVIAGILLGILVTARRYRAQGGQPRVIVDVAAWAVPFGLLGAGAHALLEAIKHDFTSEPGAWRLAAEAVAAIGVPGAIALGSAGAWIACRRAGVPLGPVAGAAAPGVAFGLAIGGLAHWWAEDFYGRPATFWLAERIGPTHRVPGFEGDATFQPAFLYQSLWDVAVGLAIIWICRAWAGRRVALSGERVFLLAAAAYAAGGLWVESIRVGPLPGVLGMPYGAWGDVLVLVVAIAVLYWTRPRKTPPLARQTPGHVISA